MYWIVAVGVVGFIALLALFISVTLLVRAWGNRSLVELPDGDYEVTCLGVDETPQGVRTTYRVESPGEHRGSQVVVASPRRRVSDGG